MELDCRAFIEMLREKLGLTHLPGWTASQAGHDFWLTRNGHGAGFWDREELVIGRLGEFLTECADKMGGCYTYAGDDGLVYVGGGEA
jgi:hypothetical protein